MESPAGMKCAFAIWTGRDGDPLVQGTPGTTRGRGKSTGHRGKSGHLHLKCRDLQPSSPLGFHKCSHQTCTCKQETERAFLGGYEYGKQKDLKTLISKFSSKIVQPQHTLKPTGNKPQWQAQSFQTALSALFLIRAETRVHRHMRKVSNVKYGNQIIQDKSNLTGIIQTKHFIFKIYLIT